MFTFCVLAHPQKFRCTIRLCARFRQGCKRPNPLISHAYRAHSQQSYLLQGTSFGAPCELENVLAKMVIERVPSVEMVRFVNSGTEACLSVLRLMRAYTKRDKVPSLRGRVCCEVSRVLTAKRHCCSSAFVQVKGCLSRLILCEIAHGFLPC